MLLLLSVVGALLLYSERASPSSSSRGTIPGSRPLLGGAGAELRQRADPAAPWLWQVAAGPCDPDSGRSIWEEAVPHAACAKAVCMWSAVHEACVNVERGLLLPEEHVAKGAASRLIRGCERRCFKPAPANRAFPSSSAAAAAEEEEEAVLVSFIFTMHNNAGMNARAIVEVFRTAHEVPGGASEIVAVDDFSTDDMGEVVRVVERLRAWFGYRVTLVRNPSNKGYGASNNIALRAARGAFAMLINSDVLVKPGWAAALLHTIRSYPRAGMVGPLILNGRGAVYEAGAVVLRDTSTYNYGRNSAPSLLPYLHAHAVDYISAACLLVRRQLFLDLGLFDPQFEPAYYEDTDAALTHLRHGWLTISQPLSVVVHSDDSAKKSFDAAKKAELMERNRVLFAAKHADLLRDFCPPAECAHRYLGTTFSLYAKERVHILILSEAIPDLAVSSSRLPRLILALQGSGCKLSMELVGFDAAAENAKKHAVSLIGSGVYLHPLGTLKRLFLDRTRRDVPPASSRLCAWDAVLAADAKALRHFRTALQEVCPDSLLIIDSGVHKKYKASALKMHSVLIVNNSTPLSRTSELELPDADLFAASPGVASAAVAKALFSVGLASPLGPGGRISRPCPGVNVSATTTITSAAAKGNSERRGASAKSRQDALTASLPGVCRECWYCSHNPHFYMPPPLVAHDIEAW